MMTGKSRLRTSQTWRGSAVARRAPCSWVDSVKIRSPSRKSGMWRKQTWNIFADSTIQTSSHSGNTTCFLLLLYYIKSSCAIRPTRLKSMLWLYHTTDLYQPWKIIRGRADITLATGWYSISDWRLQTAAHASATDVCDWLLQAARHCVADL